MMQNVKHISHEQMYHDESNDAQIYSIIIMFIYKCQSGRERQREEERKLRGGKKETERRRDPSYKYIQKLTFCDLFKLVALQWRHNGGDSISNHQPHDCLLNGLFRRRSNKTWKLRVTGLCAGNSPGTGEFPAQMASNAENVSIWWRHHGFP